MKTNPESSGGGPRPVVVLVAVLAAAVGVWLGVGFFGAGDAPDPPPPELQAGTLLSRPKPLEPFSLTDQDAQPLDLQDLRGRWTFLSFGYTHCPDVCPTTMATFNALDERINAEGAAPGADFLLVSVDPERDSPERLAQYVRYFNPRFMGATGPHDVLNALTRQLGILYARVDDQDTAMGYLVDHSASILLLDPRARLAAIFSAPHDPRGMSEDFARITARRSD